MGVVDLGKLQDQRKLFEMYDLEEEQGKQVLDYLKKMMAKQWKSTVMEMGPGGMQMNIGALSFHCYMQGMNDGAKMITDRDEQEAKMHRMMEMTDKDKLLLKFLAPLCPDCGRPPLKLWCSLLGNLELVIQKSGKFQVIGTPDVDPETLQLEDNGVYNLECVDGHNWETNDPRSQKERKDNA